MIDRESIIDTAPDRVRFFTEAVDEDSDAVRNKKPVRCMHVGPEPLGRDSGAAIGSAIMNLVQMSDRQIEKNNRLATLMDVHRRRLEKQQEIQMRKQMICDCCGMDKALSNCSGEMLCSTCASLAGAVTKRPGDVAKMIIQRGMSESVLKAMGVDQVVSATIESEVLDRLKSMVGYKGESGDELLVAVEQAVKAGKESTDPDIKSELISAQTALAEICKVLRIDDANDDLTYKHIVLAAAQTAAVVDGMMRYVGTLASEPMDLLHLVERQKDELYNMRINLKDKQSMIDSLLAKNQHPKRNGSLDTALLDLLIDMPDAPISRIQAIREAVA